MRKPYYQQLAQEEEDRKKAEAEKELKDLIQNPLKDPTQELIDEYANRAEQNARLEQLEEEKIANATREAEAKKANMTSPTSSNHTQNQTADKKPETPKKVEIKKKPDVPKK